MNIIQSKDNPKIKYAIKLAKEAKFRQEEKLFFAQGVKIVMDLIDYGFIPHSIFINYDEYDIYKNKLNENNTYIITNPVDEKLNQEKTSQGVYAIFKMKKHNTNEVFSKDKLLVLQDVQDPQNLGAIMRSALAFGYKDVVVSDKCADIYSQKVLKSSMTASVKLNVYKVNDILLLTRDLNTKGYTTIASCLEGAEDLKKAVIKPPFALYIGNEGNGLSKEIITTCTKKIKIQMSDEIQSLNAAVSAAILMWEIG